MPDLSATTELLRLLGDPARVRLLALLGREELTGAEINDITQLAEPRVSTRTNDPGPRSPTRRTAASTP
ncbi:hypothetical protein WME89_36885 [Sorangium sp. So ce321]